MTIEAYDWDIERCRAYAEQLRDKTRANTAEHAAQAIEWLLAQLASHQIIGKKREWVGLTDEEYLSKAYRLANELKCHLAIAPATQPAQTPWVGLADAEVFELFRHEGTADSDINPLKLLADARRIEAKLKEKNT